jgi:aconitate hydratase
MLNLASRSSQAWRSIQNLAKGMASVAERIGDTKVRMSLLETGAYINYQRIEDNLAIVRDRYSSSFEPVTLFLIAY